MSTDAHPLSWDIGAVRVTRVPETVMAVRARHILPALTDADLAANADWLVPNHFTADGDILLSFHSFVVRSAGRIIVVDTCVGEVERNRIPVVPAFPSRLSELAGVGLDEVDLVLCTHLHFDHVGWNMQTVDGRSVPTFPNARYLFAAAEVAHLETDDHMGIRAPSVQPIIDLGLADLVQTDYRLTSEVRLVPTPGHTPGHVSVLIESQGQRALITGDAAHSPLQFAVVELHASFDVDPHGAVATRRALIEELVDTDTLVLGTHFAPPTAGRLRHGADASDGQPTVRFLSD